eukprot:4176501-Amphidinium_carterae.2
MTSVSSTPTLRPNCNYDEGTSRPHALLLANEETTCVRKIDTTRPRKSHQLTDSTFAPLFFQLLRIFLRTLSRYAFLCKSYMFRWSLTLNKDKWSSVSQSEPHFRVLVSSLWVQSASLHIAGALPLVLLHLHISDNATARSYRHLTQCKNSHQHPLVGSESARRKIKSVLAESCHRGWAILG